MASSLRRGRLVCFYCGTRSDVRQDGHIRRWACTTCEAVNYLDTDGNITDPPASIAVQSSNSVRYAHTTPPAAATASPKGEGFQFCDTCMLNQHKFASGIAAYEPDNMDYDPDRPLSPDRKFIQYRRNLLSMYPQTCDECEQGVKEALAKAKRLAGADNFRRRLAGTRINREVKRKRTRLENFSSLGGVLYWSAIVGQVALSIVGLLQSGLPSLHKACLSDAFELLPDFSPEFKLSLESLLTMACRFQPVAAASIETATLSLPFLAKWSFILTISSLWWNPFFRNMIRGFDTHIHGFVEWYCYQVILLVTRVVFWYALGNGVLSGVDGPATIGAHCFMLGFTIFITIISRRSIKVDYRRLFALTPEEIRVDQKRQQKTSAYNNNNGLAQILDGILSEPSSTPSIKSSTKGQYIGPSDIYRSGPFERQSSIPQPTHFPEAKVSLSSMSEEEGFRYLTQGELPAHVQDDGDQMEWTPTHPRVTTFNPRLRPVTQAATAGTVSDSRPFWFKLPPAPTSAAHKLRNPPTQPQFFAPPKEEKENFFNNLTGKQSTFGTARADNGVDRREMRMQQQRLFIPQEDLTEDLSEYMAKSFSLKTTGTDSDVASNGTRGETKKFDASRRTHLLSLVVLLCSFGAWNIAYSHENVPTYSVTMGIMGICEALALRTVTDHAINDLHKGNLGISTALAILLAGVEAAVAGLAMIEIWAGRGHTSNCQSLGTIVVGVMLVQELWFTLL